MITPSTPLEHILQLHVSTLRPVLGNIEWKHIHDLNTWPPVRLSRYKAKKTEALKRAKAKYYQSIKEKPEFLEHIVKNSKIYYERHKDETEFKAYKIQHVKTYQEKNNEYYTNQRHERLLKEVVETRGIRIWEDRGNPNCQ